MYAPEREATPEGFDARRLGRAIGKAGVNARAAGDTAREAMRPVGDAFSKTGECVRMVVPFVVPTLGIVSLIVFAPFLLPFMFGYADLSLLTSGVIGDIREVDVLQAFPLMLSLSYLVLTVEARVKDGGVSWREDEGAILFLRWASPVFVGGYRCCCGRSLCGFVKWCLSEAVWLMFPPLPFGALRTSLSLRRLLVCRFSFQPPLRRLAADIRSAMERSHF